jgi:hypothetical protein
MSASPVRLDAQGGGRRRNTHVLSYVAAFIRLKLPLERLTHVWLDEDETADVDGLLPEAVADNEDAPDGPTERTSFLFREPC